MFKAIWRVTVNAVNDFIADDAMTLSGALAFYSALSFAPLLVLLIWASSVIGQDTQEQVIGEVQTVMGSQAGQTVELIIDNADRRPNIGTVSGFVSIGMLLFTASAVFAQLQASLNRVWNVQAVPHGYGIWSWLRKRLISMGMIIAIAFLLLVSLIVSTALGLLLPSETVFWQVVTSLISLVVFAGLFAACFHYLPDVQVNWRDVWIGAGLTAVLFALGKFGLGVYFRYSDVAGPYGPAGALLLLLLWAYYSSLIFFFGAEMTQALAAYRGSPIIPDEHAEPIIREKIVIKPQEAQR